LPERSHRNQRKTFILKEKTKHIERGYARERLLMVVREKEVLWAQRTKALLKQAQRQS